MPDSNNLQFSYVSQNQSQKEVTVNEALLRIDALLNRGAVSQGENTPPAEPEEGDLYIVAESATSDWEGKEGAITFYANGAWYFITPNEGMTLWVNNEDLPYTFDGASWVVSGGGGGGEGFAIDDPQAYDILQYDGSDFINQDHIANLAHIGVNTMADSTGRLAVASDTILFEAETDDIRVMINKASASDTASVIFQDNASGRAEIGLTGDDDMSLRVSDDGSAWVTALKVDKSTGDIKNAQRIGIGGTPSYLLDIASTTDNLLRAATVYNGVANMDYINTDSNSSSAIRQRFYTRNVAGSGDVSGDLTKYKAGAFHLMNYETDSAANTSFGVGGTIRVRINSAGNLIPGADNAYTLGATTARWSAVWAANGTIQTSDARMKTEVEPLEGGLEFIQALQPVSYQWISGGNELVFNADKYAAHENSATPEDAHDLVPRAGERRHYGLLAQQVKQAVEQCELGDFGGWILTDPEDENSEQGLRYDQFIAPLIKAVQELAARVEALESA